MISKASTGCNFCQPNSHSFHTVYKSFEFLDSLIPIAILLIVPGFLVSSFKVSCEDPDVTCHVHHLLSVAKKDKEQDK